MIDNPARNYDPVAVSEESTVVAEYIAEPAEETAYQSEAELEREFISILRSQAYEQLPIHTEDQLLANLRTQLECATTAAPNTSAGGTRKTSTTTTCR